MQVTDELRVLVEAEVARAIENFKKLDSSIDGAEQKTKSLGDALDSVSKTSMIMSGVIAGAGVAAIKFAGENEKLKLSLKNMLGSAEEASAVFEDWRRLGTSPGLSTDEVFTLGRAMVNMGHDTDYATQTIQMLGDVAAGTGSSFGAISGSFERVRAAGKLTTRDLTNLQQQGIPVLKQLAKELGTSEEGVRRLANEGKLGFSDLERAFKGMTTPGGQFAGMMDELSGTTLEKFNTATDDAKQALASFGETMLPIATGLLDGASSILRGISDMDEGTKRFVIGMGGMVAVSGPVIAAINGIRAAMTALMANPYMLAIGGVIAAAGIVAGIVNKQAHAYDDLQKKIKETDEASKNLLAAYANGNNEKVLDEKTTRELIKLYPELTGVIKENNTTVEEGLRLQREANEQRVIDAQHRKIELMQRDQAALRLVIREWNRLEDTIANPGPYNDLDELNQMLERTLDEKDYLIREIEAKREEINAVLSSIGKQLTLNGEIIDISVSVSMNTEALESPPAPSAAAKKRWQDWYGEIVKIDPAQFGDSGAKAAELYLGEFSRSFEAGKTVFAQLGEELDIAETLRSQQADIQKALVELFSINPADIDQPFEAAGEPVRQLIEEYKRLGAEAKAAEDAIKAVAVQKEFEQTIADITKRIDDFNKSERQLAYEAELARIGLSAQSDQARELMEAMDAETVARILSELDREVQNLTKDQYDLALATLEAAGATAEERAEAEKLIKQLKEGKTAAASMEDAIKSLGKSLLDLGSGAVLGGLEELGRAFGQSTKAEEAMQNALVSMSQEILNALPNLFLQAGLQLIGIPGMWPLGLGFIAAAGSSALIKGYVDGEIDKAQANAHGNVFDTAGIQPFARGGMFTNQVVQSPTFFKFSRGTGLMGEAGPEAIIPLKRMANGDLGVQTANGGGTQVVVNIINNSGTEVRQEEHEDGMGNKQIDIIIGEMVNRHIASGKADRAMGARYGARAQGV
ncbi:MAG: tape measure protein [Treponema sp.]|nr:tape measure protein [Treponema sp.]